ncbi:MAG TPA: PH domain-containing protein [Phycisphaerae bacterium]|nr:PH domain-containing protein [Phycisphaerae bacterium]
MTTDLLHPSVLTDAEASVDMPPSSATFPAPAAAVPSELLDGGEIVILAVKPSLWSVAFASFPWVLGGAIIVAFTTWLAGTPNPVATGPLVQLTLAVVALRIGMAVLQWVSRVYVLTNRRIMRIRGVFRASVFACPLVKVINTGVTVVPHEKLARLGSIWFNTGTNSDDGTWYHVTHPEEIHDQIRRAIERALDAHH